MVGIRSTLRLVSMLGISLAAALPIASNNVFPLNDGFPTPSDAQLEKIFDGAHGSLPDTPPPTLHSDTLKSLQLIATNEMAEVSLYSTCYLKLHNRDHGFGDDNFADEAHRQFVVDTFRVFAHQEEIHALLAQGALQANGEAPVQPSRYQFNTDTYQDCLNMANILGDNVLATSQGVIQRAIEVGDGGLAVQLDSLVAQEGEQDGFLRSEQVVKGKHTRLPAAMPAYTGSTREWLFSILERIFIKPGTDKNNIDIPVYLLMNVDNKYIEPINQDLDFEVHLHTKTGNNYNDTKYDEDYDWHSSDLYLTIITGQNLPISQPLKNVQVNKKQGSVKFSAYFPAADRFIHAYALAALTKGKDFVDPASVTNSTIAGPATIELID